MKIFGIIDAIYCVVLSADLACASGDIRVGGSSVGRVESDGTIRIRGIAVGRFESSGQIRIRGVIVGRIESGGGIRKAGSIVAQVKSDGKVRVSGSVRGKIESDGDAMEPTVPSGSYCLFGPETDGDREGKVLFVAHSGLNDPHTGGSWTVRRFDSVERKDVKEEWTHDRIVLRPDNAEYPAFTLEVKSETSLQLLGEFVCVISDTESSTELLEETTIAK